MDIKVLEKMTVKSILIEIRESHKRAMEFDNVFEKLRKNINYEIENILMESGLSIHKIKS